MQHLRLVSICCRSSRRTARLVPYLFTFANACFGLGAVLYAIEGSFVLSAYCLVLAALVDGLDGRLARALGSTSPLGMELDSLCDAISFCFAPALVLYCFSLEQAGIIGLFAAGLYLCCGLFRLARFNNIGGCPGGFFTGLPTTFAALICAAFVLHGARVLPGAFVWSDRPFVFVVLLLALSYLMICRLRFPSFKASVRKCRFSQIVAFCMGTTAVCAWFLNLPLLLSLLLAYVASSLLGNAIRGVLVV